jgi:uncharacterized membrane protein
MTVQQTRNTKDRFRHATLFEIIGLCLAVPLVAWGFGTDLVDTGVLGIALSVMAMIWNMIYNHYFDVVLLKIGLNPEKRGLIVRGLHALLFEGGFIVISVPVAAWWLSISLVEALVMDISVTLFYLGYTYVYNLCYDAVFPYPAERSG